MKKIHKFWGLSFFAILAIFLNNYCSAEELKCVGVLGNSGEQGDTIIRFSPKRGNRDGIGVYVDDKDTIWSRAGIGQVNRYSMDGRLLATYKIPKQESHTDFLMGFGKNIVLQLREKLYQLRTDAEPGSSAKPYNIESALIGFSADPTKFPMVDKSKNLYLVNSENGQKKKVMTFQGKSPNFIFLAKDGTVYAVIDWKMREIRNGKLIPNANPPKAPGERPQLIDGYWYGYAWHGTIKRFDKEFNPDPGIVLGGSSGSFIGHLAENAEISNPRGLCKVNDDLWVVGGMNGSAHLLQWLPKEKRFEIVRRIGPKQVINGTLAVDDKGRVMVPGGNWIWTDGPDTPLRLGSGFGGNGQAVALDNGAVVASAFVYGSSPTLAWGSMDKELKRFHDSNKKYKFRTGNSGMVVLKKEKKIIAYIINPKGQGQRIWIHGDGKPRETLSEFKLETKSPVKKWSTMAKVDDNKVLAAGDGHIIEFDTTNPTVWKETKRWNQWGKKAGDKFGDTIQISSDRKRLWVSDTERHRVLCFNLKTGTLIDTFGTLDKAGTDLASMTKPSTIHGRAGRAVVFDEGNQRILKLELK